MGQPVLHVGAVGLCPHGGALQFPTGAARVKVGGQPALTLAPPFLIAGCPFVVGPAPSPCLTGRWVVASQRVKVGGDPLVLRSSVGVCSSPAQAPQGPPQITAAQGRVKAQ